MSMVKVIDTWTCRLPAEPERHGKRADGSEWTIPASEERTSTLALVRDELSGVQVNIELPVGPELSKIVAESVIQIEIPDFPDTPIRARRLTRVIPPAKR